MPSSSAIHRARPLQPPTVESPRRQRGLSEQSIVTAAIEIIGEHGVEGLSMRRLSHRLGVTLGATYKHVPHKHALLKLVAQELYSRIEPPDPSKDEFEQAKLVMRQVHDTLSAYPGMAAYIAQHVPEFSSVDLANLIMDPLRTAGLSEAEARRITLALILINGGHMLTVVPPEGKKEMAAALETGMDFILAGGRAAITESTPLAVPPDDR